MSHTKLVTVAALALLACNKDRPTDTGAPGATAAATGTPAAPAASPTAPAASPTAPAASPTAAAAPNLAAPPAAVTVAVQGKPAGPVIEAGCSFDGRQLKGNEGDLFQVSCPAGCDKQDTTWGTGVYSANSPICRSGIHAGAIPRTGGTMTVKLEAGRPAYRGSEQNGIESRDFNEYNRSFAVVVAGAVPAPPAIANGKAVIEAGCGFDGRQLKGNDGDTFQVSCPAGCDKRDTTWGTGVYSANSPICRSGIHAGAIPSTGGTVTVKLEAGRPAYRGSEQHGIESRDFNEYNRSFAVVVAGAAPAAPATANGKPVIEAGCSFDGRQLKGNDGDTFQVSCPAGCDKQDATWGTGVYSANSPICRSGIHAGAIPNTGGTVTVKLEAGRPAYRGSEQNGIESRDFNEYNRSYAVVVAGAAPAAPATANGKAVIEAGCSFDGRQLKGNDGDTFQVSCPAGCDKQDATWGTGVYSAHSPICRSGIHAGAIPSTGGTVTVKLEAGRPAYRGSKQNGIESRDFNEYNRSYSVVTK